MRVFVRVRCGLCAGWFCLCVRWIFLDHCVVGLYRGGVVFVAYCGRDVAYLSKSPDHYWLGYGCYLFGFFCS